MMMMDDDDMVMMSTMTDGPWHAVPAPAALQIDVVLVQLMYGQKYKMGDVVVDHAVPV